MKEWIIIFDIWLAMIATAFWESSVEGKKAGPKGKLGWKIRKGRKVILTSYHFWLFIIMFPALLAIPLIMNYSTAFLGVLLTAYFSGLVIEDFVWFWANPKFKIKQLNPKEADWHFWVKVFGINIPITYIIGIGIAIASWFLLWK